MVAFFFLFINCLHIILTTMRQSNNKHYDTLGGFSAILANVSSHIKAPSVSLKDETMNQKQKDLLIELVKLERNRLTFALTAWNITEDEMRELNQERDLCTSTLKSGVSDMEIRIMFEQPNWYIVFKVSQDGEFEVIGKVNSYDKAVAIKEQAEGGE